MKKIFTLFSLVLLITTTAFAQSDSVCSGANNKIYDVSPSLGSTYSWSLKNGLGTINTVAGRTDSILINYGTTAGIDTLRLVEIGPSGCFGDTVKMSIVILPTVNATISGTDSICINNSSLAKLNITLSGTSPWNVTYTDGTTPVTVNGITSSPYLINSPVYATAGIKTFTITSATGLGSCPANISGSGNITVFPKPGALTILKY